VGEAMKGPRAQRRRENAPIRPRRPATVVPDVLFAFAMTTWTMAAVFTVATFVSDDVTAGEAGKILARVFSAILGVTGVLLFLLGVMLLRDERQQADHFTAPFVVGVVIGGLEATLFLAAAGAWLPLPFVLLVFILRPVRRLAGRLVGRGQ